MKHHCHAIDCKAPCAPKLLMCRKHWFMVHPDIREEVYATYRARGPRMDASWAPWWRAQTRARACVALEEGIDPTPEVTRGMAHADRLERRTKVEGT